VDEDAVDAELARRNGHALREFFAGADLSPKKVRQFAEALIVEDSSTDVSKLKLMSEEDDFKDWLKECGVGGTAGPKRLDMVLIRNALEVIPMPPRRKPFLLGYFGADANAEKERDLIKIMLNPAKLGACCEGMGTVADLQVALERSTKNRVLHLAMHGDQKTPEGKYTLAFHEEKSREGKLLRFIVEPDLLAEVIARWCGGSADGDGDCMLDCVVINACHGSEIAMAIRDAIDKQEVMTGTTLPVYIAAWSTAVDDRAAYAFAQAFYRALAVRGHSDWYEQAFYNAVDFLKLRGWVVDENGGDPQLGKELLALRRLPSSGTNVTGENRPDLDAAGIPRLYSASRGSRGSGGATQKPKESTEPPVAERTHGGGAGAGSHVLGLLRHTHDLDDGGKWCDSERYVLLDQLGVECKNHEFKSLFLVSEHCPRVIFHKMVGYAVKFISACLNARTDGTIYFGVAEGSAGEKEEARRRFGPTEIAEGEDMPSGTVLGVRLPNDMAEEYIREDVFGHQILEAFSHDTKPGGVQDEVKRRIEPKVYPVLRRKDRKKVEEGGKSQLCVICIKVYASKHIGQDVPNAANFRCTVREQRQLELPRLKLHVEHAMKRVWRDTADQLQSRAAPRAQLIGNICKAFQFASGVLPPSGDGWVDREGKSVFGDSDQCPLALEGEPLAQVSKFVVSKFMARENEAKGGCGIENDKKLKMMYKKIVKFVVTRPPSEWKREHSYEWTDNIESYERNDHGNGEVQKLGPMGGGDDEAKE
jgi:hypothetical protein